MKIKCPLALAAASLSLSAFHTPAYAQPEIEEILVTGQKVSRSLQDTTDSVAVMSSEMMDDQVVLSMDDVLQQTANVSVQPGRSFTIRGIDAFTVSGDGGGNGGLASVYLDNAPLPYRMVQKSGFSTWDIRQVEVLRGPQSTLQGRNSLAGAIVAQSRDPDYAWDGKVRILGGDYGQHNFAGAVGGGLIDDLLSFRISGESSHLDGFNENSNNGDNTDYQESDTHRVKLKLSPLDNLDIIWGYNAIDEKIGAKFTNAPPAGQDQYGYRKLDFNTETFEFNKGDIVTQEINLYMGDHWQFSSITGYSDLDYGYQWDGDAGNTPPDLVQLDERTDETWTQEFRGVFNYERLSGVVGAYYSDLETTDDAYGQRILSFTDVGVTPALLSTVLGITPDQADLLLGFYAPVDPAIIGVTSETYQKITTAALFGDLTYSATDKLNLLFGARWDNEDHENSSLSNYTVDNFSQFPNPANYPAPINGAVSALNGFILAQAQDASGTEPVEDASFNAFLPKIGISYHWTDALTTSFLIKQGYRSGGISRNVARNEVVKYDPEYLTNYELSLRSVWLEGDLIANLNVFYYDWEDQQVTVQLSGNTFDTQTENAGKSTVKGAEIDLQYYIARGLKLYSGIGYAKTEFNEFFVQGEDQRGRPFQGAPEWTGNIGATWHSELGIFANINVNYTDSSNQLVYLGENPAAGFDPQNDEHTLVNFKVGYEWQQMGVYLIGSNVLDEEYISIADTSTGTSTGTQTYGAPRQLSVSFEAQF